MGLNKKKFYQTHLDQVSRSFAFCIAELKSPLREWVGLAYILCRIADTLEDAQWTDRALQLKAMSEMKRFVTDGDYSETELEKWRNRVPLTIPQREKDLLKDAGRFFADLRELPPAAFQAIHGTLIHMLGGMAHFCATAPANSALQINDLRHANQYCFFVAGIVGELLTDLVKIDTPEFQLNSGTFVDAIHFGLFLQKINLLKDQMTDEKEGRFLVHSREAFKQSLAQNACGSLRYLTSLPATRRDYRLFCAWSLFLGLASLPWIEQAWSEQSQIKISRTETALLLAKVRLKIDDNAALEKLFQDLMTLETAQSIVAAQPTALAVPIWLTQVYHGQIAPEQMHELGLA